MLLQQLVGDRILGSLRLGLSIGLDHVTNRFNEVPADIA
jgi:hypothetical protein